MNFQYRRTAALVFLLVSAACAWGDPVGATNNAAITPAPLPDMGGSVVRVFGALILVIGVFLGGVWLLRNWQRLSMNKGGAPKLSVLEMKSLGQRQAIYVIGYQQQRLLLASSQAGVTLISHLPAAEEGEAPVAPSQANFVEALQHVLSRKS